MPAARPKKESDSGSDDTNTKEGASESGKIKRKRQSQSCDACRARKVRCARENPDDPQSSCKHCIALGIPCTYDYQPKKRGPPNLYLRRLQEAAAAAAVQQQQQQESQNGDAASPVSSRPNLGSPRQSSTATVPTVSQPGASFLEQSLNNVVPSLPSSSLPSSRFALSTDTYHPHFQSISSSSFGSPTVDQRSTKVEDTQPFVSPSEHFSTYPLYNWAYRQHQPVPPPSALPPLSYYYRPHRLEDIAPRDTIMLIIALFFDFVYPLTPCVHKPSYMADLHARREERDPLFFALVMSTVASTLVQLPRSYLPMERHAVRKLAQTCHEASRHISVASYDPPTSMHVVIRYFDCVYHFCEGHDATQHAAFGEAAHIAVTLRMHEESSYEGLDLIECEVRRRTFWLLFGADKSMSILLGRPICLRDEDCTVHFPKELDDEYITPSAYLPQPHGKPSLVSGLNYITRIFALLGEILVRIRVDKRSPPQGQYATARLEEVQSLHSRIMSALLHAPEPLRLKQTSQTNIPSDYGGAGFRQATFAEVKDFFDNPNASRANALNPFLVMQANLYVTQQLVRFVIEQYRDELVTQIRGSNDEQRIADDREAVASDLLNILHNIPIQSIATNGPSLVHKVRFVASTLLDAVRKAETAPATAARAHAYLWDFLSILSEIERNYLYVGTALTLHPDPLMTRPWSRLDDDRDATSSGDGMATLLGNN
ncbi:fungal-specific transcription factor domain-containing protein [Gloeopeniophorella convolvens]|nr:fungal-specific transcription factor domain-containing protein [Gloeopeniophorella convolvens]